MKDYKEETTIDKKEWTQGVWSFEPDVATWKDDLSDYACGIERSQETGALSGYLALEQGHPAYEQPLEATPIHLPAENKRAYKDDEGKWRYEQTFDAGQPARGWRIESYQSWNYVLQEVTNMARELYALTEQGKPPPQTPPKDEGEPARPGEGQPPVSGDTPKTPPPSDGPAPQNPGSGDSSPTPDNPVGTPDAGDQGDKDPVPPATNQPPPPSNPVVEDPTQGPTPPGQQDPPRNPDGSVPGQPDAGQTGGSGNEGQPSFPDPKPGQGDKGPGSSDGDTGEPTPPPDEPKRAKRKYGIF